LFFSLILLYMYLQMLERFWGDLRLTIYCGIGIAATAAAAMLFDVTLASNWGFNVSLFLAFARLNPEFEIMLFFFFPVKMRWIFMATAFVLGATFAFGDGVQKFMTLAGVANYLLFFGRDHWYDWKRRFRRRR
jgi:hypothetical protein